MRRIWQATMIALARSSRAKRWVQGQRSASSLASCYVAGVSAETAVDRAAAMLREDGLRSSLFYLGEYVDRCELVEENVAAKLLAAELLGRTGLDVHVSVDPTQIGHMLDPALARNNAFKIAEAIALAENVRPGVHVLMLDMEDQSVTDSTIALHRELTAARLPVALTLQAYLRRTEGDLVEEVRRGSKVRLVKGAFAAHRSTAFPTQTAIKANSRRLIDIMLSQQARDAGFYAIIATHDHQLQNYAIERAAENGWSPGEYEFEMLLGVRSDLANDLVRRGARVRLYMPFGRDWWPYAIRRIGENPRNAVLLTRSLIDAR
jgi:proline dehydrogenase